MQPTTDQPSDQAPLTLKQAAAQFGTTTEAIRLRVRRGTLTRVPLTNGRGQQVVGVLPQELQQAFGDTNSEGGTTDQPTKVVTSKPTNHRPTTQPSELEAELAKERSLRQAQAETNSRALAVIQDRQLAPIFERLESRIDQAKGEAAAARKDSRIFAVLALTLVGALGAFSVYRIQAATGSTVQAHERTIEAMESTQAAQAQALSQATQRAAVETELVTVKQQAKDAQAAAEKAQNQLMAIALMQRVRGIAITMLRSVR